MLHPLLLNGTWDLRDEILGCDLREAVRIAAATDGWLPQPIPGDIHQGLEAAGKIPPPLVGTNSLACTWTEYRSWWFRRRFTCPEGWDEADAVELELNGLDANAEIFLNGRHLGSHRNAFRPFVLDVKPHLLPGDNTLLVRLSVGTETVTDADLDAPDGVRAATEAGNGRPERGDPRRTFVRKPQYSWGWDWSPRLATTAIGGDVLLRPVRHACIRNVAPRPVRRGDAVTVETSVLVDRVHYYQTRDAELVLTLTDAQGRDLHTRRPVLLRSGSNFIDLSVAVPQPQYWWPAGLGEQHLYQVVCELRVAGACVARESFAWGLRFLELQTGPGLFALAVNGRRVFCRGANWIPAETLYATVTDARYDELVRLAREANFNTLRVWGGGLYEREAFYQACDRHGILLWHDFMFACAPYPDHLPWFQAEVEKEAEHQTRRLQRHACLALWSGSNENNWGFRDWWQERTRGGAVVYNHILPAAVARNCPEIPYWNGSPYGGEAPNCEEVGDRHHWGDCMMSPDMGKRITPEEYDACNSLFISEFGYVGACGRETTLAYLGTPEADRAGAAWKHHTNTFEKGTVEAGIRKHYRDPEGLSLDDYLYYSGLCQGLMYSYALESMRYRANCHGGLFWMYADCWGELGWTVVDYYLRRKLSYWFVRRAFAPLRLILRRQGGRIRAVLANDTPADEQLTVEYGYVSLDGTRQALRRRRVRAPALARTEAALFAPGPHDPLGGLWIARVPGRPDIAPALFRAVDLRALALPEPGLDARARTAGRGCAVVTVKATAYAHAVHLELPEGALPDDDHFDLLPGETRQVRVCGLRTALPARIAVRCANDRLPRNPEAPPACSCACACAAAARRRPRRKRS